MRHRRDLVGPARGVAARAALIPLELPHFGRGTWKKQVPRTSNFPSSFKIRGVGDGHRPALADDLTAHRVGAADLDGREILHVQRDGGCGGSLDQRHQGRPARLVDDRGDDPAVDAPERVRHIGCRCPGHLGVTILRGEELPSTRTLGVRRWHVCPLLLRRSSVAVTARILPAGRPGRLFGAHADTPQGDACSGPSARGSPRRRAGHRLRRGSRSSLGSLTSRTANHEMTRVRACVQQPSSHGRRIGTARRVKQMVSRGKPPRSM